MSGPFWPNRSPLAPAAFSRLPLGAVRPLGWLRRQLRIQADGLTGHLDEFWPDVGPESAWRGGAGEGWERGPYYLDGLVPLAYLLDDRRLIAKAQPWLDWALDHQQPDGWLGPLRDPRDTRHRAYDAWPVFVMLKALTQYEEARGDSRVLPAVLRFLAFLRDNLDRYPLFSWGAYRWADLLLSVVWAYNRSGEPWLLPLAAALHRQGYDWSDHFRHFRYPGRVMGDYHNLATHVVNNAMGLKAPGILWQLSDDPADRDAVAEGLAALDRYHGQAGGVFSGDEHLAGLDPTQGTELCAVVELLFSLECLLAILGEPSLGDRLERAAYNALPATLTPDLWAHQYDQQANQVLCSVAPRHWTNNGDDANIFGLEPNFGCCTANLHQGWPKFAASLWLATPDGGLAAVAYGPCEVTTSIDGRRVTVREETDYPFADTLRFTIAAEAPVELPLTLRVPAWCASATLEVGGETRPLAPRRFHTVRRHVAGPQTLTLRLPMPLHAESRHRGALTLERGPLVYALAPGERWRQIGGEAPHADWEVAPTTPWNYALAIDRQHPEHSISVTARPLADDGPVPFSPEGAPVQLAVPARRVPGWTLERNSAGPVPESPVATAAPLETVTLLPYGCTNLRVTEFPWVDLSPDLSPARGEERAREDR